MLTHRAVTFLCLCAFALSATAQSDKPAPEYSRRERPVLFQVSTLDALSQGVFQGSYPVRLLKQRGDFGLGTYDGIDGEMVVLDGHYYQAYSDGTVKEAADDELAPFAAVTEFKPQASYTLSNVTMAQIGAFLTSVLPSANLSYAIKITGMFSRVTTRAIPKQFPPYPTLAVATATESIFNNTDIEGTAVVIRSPAFEKGINVVGDHFHFISNDHKVAGHVLALTARTITLQVQTLPQTTLWLPENKAFLNATLPLP